MNSTSTPVNDSNSSIIESLSAKTSYVRILNFPSLSCPAGKVVHSSSSLPSTFSSKQPESGALSIIQIIANNFRFMISPQRDATI